MTLTKSKAPRDIRPAGQHWEEASNLSSGGLSGPLIYPPIAVEASQDLAGASAIEANEHISSPLVFTGIFSADECERIIELGATRRWRMGKMMYAQPNVRKSTIAWIGCDSESDWLYAKVWQTFQAVNRWFKFDLRGLIDELQLAKYSAEDRFEWHLDAGGGPTCTRKISLSVQLSDGTDYMGGDLEFSACGALEERRRQGTIIAFPAFLSHRVTPVAQGSRYSLVAWAHGPSFR